MSCALITGAPVLVTERLELWHPAASDLPALHAMVSPEAVRRFLGNRPTTRAEEAARLLQMVREPKGMLAGQLGNSVAELGAALQRDARLQIMVNRFARRTLVGIATRYGGQIVRLVSETVKRWDARTVTDRIEGAVGRATGPGSRCELRRCSARRVGHRA